MDAPDLAAARRERSALLRPRTAGERLIVGLDLPDLESAERMVAELGEVVGFYKIGMELVFAGGLALVERLVGEGKRVFLDMKLLDIDNTVAGGIAGIGRLGATLTTVHAYPKAMRAAASARGGAGLGLLAVTVLTSMDDGDLSEAGYVGTAAELVRRRAAQAKEAGMDGIVCSPLEAEAMRALLGQDMLIVTPGVRPSGADRGDQKRVMTPTDALKAGGDYLVVARPVVKAPNPRRVAEALVEEIEAAS
ncbi:orotidine-5'-phosphate decarboxylase [Afifella sp. IM 167]|uniref:orotidine-5'-phosphate decarboxylase n=1 Tax=Afifella sp. IM 167 TaxID=2033586 RepID=UPI001CCFC3AC|nr:orotidine-5'-phosphate decarboxylase [Afifella sp. IM 167]MBZ8133562.1 orotidine-5'-phosphate decarboxylase [Afifella sp. IM 167]